jgi:hypothetical protein
MSDFLTRLAERALGLTAVVEPRSVGLFTPVDESAGSWTAEVPAESFAGRGQPAIPPTAPPATRLAPGPEAQDTPAPLRPSRPDHAAAGPLGHYPAMRTYAVDAPGEGASTAPDHMSGATRALVSGDRSSIDHGVRRADPIRAVSNAAGTSPAEDTVAGRRPSDARVEKAFRLSTAQAESRVPAGPLHPSIVAAAGAARAGAPDTRVEITIGRIDVRAPEARSAEGQRAIRRREEPGLSLSDYLRGARRSRGGR